MTNYSTPLPCERLLLLACSGDKRATAEGEQLSPIDLYTGAMYTVLRKWMPALDRCEIRILSAKHGLVTDQWPKLSTYDERMSRQKAEHLIAGGIFGQFDGFGSFKRGTARGSAPADYLRPAHGFRYREIFVAAGAEYRQVFQAWILEMKDRGMLADDCVVTEVHGGIGEQRSQLGAWLRSIAPAADMHEAA